MYERAATLLVDALYFYGIAGSVFAIAFVTTGGDERIDSQAIGSVRWLSCFYFPGFQLPSAPSYFAGGFL